MRGGVYFLYYHHETPVTIKIGCSKDFEERIREYKLTIDNPEFAGFLHSPLYCFEWKFKLEKLVHAYFKQFRVQKLKERFQFPPNLENKFDLGFESRYINGLLHFLKCHNIDATFYKNLFNVPLTDLQTIRRNEQRKQLLLEAANCNINNDQNNNQKPGLRNAPVAQPRHFQIPIIENLLEHFSIENRGCLFLPPGIGKTFITMFFLHQSYSTLRKVLILTPQILICQEFEKAFEKIFYQSKKTCITFNSDETNIVEYFETLPKDNFVFITTFASLQKHLNLFKTFKFDLIVYDEAHHLATSSVYQSSIDLDSESKKLFLTATPVIIDIFKDDDDGNFKTFSLDDEKIFGKCIHHLSLMEAIDEGYLCDYRLLVYTPVDNNTIETKTDKKKRKITQLEETKSDNEDESENDMENEETKSDNDMEGDENNSKNSDVDEENENSDNEFSVNESDNESSEIESDNEDEKSEISNDEMIETGISIASILENLIVNYDCKTIIVFYNSCNRARLGCESVQIQNCQCVYVDSSTTKNEKQTILNFMSTFPSLREEKSKIRVLFNVNIVGEGISIDCVDTIVYMEARKSEKSIIQTLGRGLRLHGEKEGCIICIPPTLIDLISPIGSALYCEATAFKKNYNSETIQKSILDRIITESNTINVAKNICKTVSQTVKMVEISKTGGKLEYKLKLCQQWEFENPDKTITSRLNFNNANIGDWIHNQKRKFKENKLSEKELQELKKLRIWQKWLKTPKIPKQPVLSFQESLNNCLQWESENPDKTITSRLNFNNANIGVWINNQKTKFKKNQLSEKELQELKKLRIWQKWLKTPKTPKQPVLSFQERLNNVLQFEHENPDKTITARLKFNNTNIGVWIHNQKTKFKENKLSENELQELKKLRIWRDETLKKPVLSFQERLNNVLQFEHENPDKTITARLKFNNANIGVWINNQKTKFKENKLSENELQELNKLKSWRNWLKQKQQQEINVNE